MLFQTDHNTLIFYRLSPTNLQQQLGPGFTLINSPPETIQTLTFVRYTFQTHYIPQLN